MNFDFIWNCSFFWAAINIFPKIFLLSSLKIFLRTKNMSLAAISAISIMGIFSSFKFIFAGYMKNNDVPLIGKYFHREKTWMLVAQIISCSTLGAVWYGINTSNLVLVGLSVAISVIAEAVYDIAFAKFQVDFTHKKGSFFMFNAHKTAAFISNIVSLLIFFYMGLNVAFGVLLFLSIMGLIPIFLFAPEEPFFKERPGLTFEKIQNDLRAFFYLFGFFCVKQVIFGGIEALFSWDFVSGSAMTLVYILINSQLLRAIVSGSNNILPYMCKIGILHILSYIMSHLGIISNTYDFIFFLLGTLCFFLSSYIINFFIEKNGILQRFVRFFFAGINYSFPSNDKSKQFMTSMVIGAMIFLGLVFVSNKLIQIFVYRILDLIIKNKLSFFILFPSMVLFLGTIIFRDNPRFFGEQVNRINNKMSDFWFLLLFIFFYKSAKMFTHGVRDVIIFDNTSTIILILSKIVNLGSGVLGGLISKMFNMKRLSLRSLCIIGSLIGLGDSITNLATLYPDKYLIYLGVGIEHVLNGLAMSALMEVTATASLRDKAFLHTMFWGVFEIARSFFGGSAGYVIQIFQLGTFGITLVTAVLSFIPFVMSFFVPLKKLEKKK